MTNSCHQLWRRGCDERCRRRLHLIAAVLLLSCRHIVSLAGDCATPPAIAGAIWRVRGSQLYMLGCEAGWDLTDNGTSNASLPMNLTCQAPSWNLPTFKCAPCRPNLTLARTPETISVSFHSRAAAMQEYCIRYSDSGHNTYSQMCSTRQPLTIFGASQLDRCVIQGRVHVSGVWSDYSAAYELDGNALESTLTATSPSNFSWMVYGSAAIAIFICASTIFSCKPCHKLLSRSKAPPPIQVGHVNWPEKSSATSLPQCTTSSFRMQRKKTVTEQLSMPQPEAEHPVVSERFTAFSYFCDPPPSGVTWARNARKLNGRCKDGWYYNSPADRPAHLDLDEPAYGLLRTSGDATQPGGGETSDPNMPKRALKPLSKEPGTTIPQQGFSIADQYSFSGGAPPVTITSEDLRSVPHGAQKQPLSATYSTASQYSDCDLAPRSAPLALVGLQSVTADQQNADRYHQHTAANGNKTEAGRRDTMCVVMDFGIQEVTESDCDSCHGSPMNREHHLLGMVNSAFHEAMPDNPNPISTAGNWAPENPELPACDSCTGSRSPVSPKLGPGLLAGSLQSATGNSLKSASDYIDMARRDVQGWSNPDNELRGSDDEAGYEYIGVQFGARNPHGPGGMRGSCKSTHHPADAARGLRNPGKGEWLSTSSNVGSVSDDDYISMFGRPLDSVGTERTVTTVHPQPRRHPSSESDRGVGSPLCHSKATEGNRDYTPQLASCRTRSSARQPKLELPSSKSMILPEPPLWMLADDDAAVPQSRSIFVLPHNEQVQQQLQDVCDGQYAGELPRIFLDGKELDVTMEILMSTPSRRRTE